MLRISDVIVVGAVAGSGGLSALIDLKSRRVPNRLTLGISALGGHLLWHALKELPLDGTHFRRQTPIGPYVVDFFCPAKRLIVELDGGHHNETKPPNAIMTGSFGLSASARALGRSR